MDAGNPQYLLGLARDKSDEGRHLLANVIADLFSGRSDSITDQERSLIFQVLQQLVIDTESSLRAVIAERIANLEDAPPDLVNLLANDEIKVAFPILSQSTVLRDPDLIEIIRHRAVEHQLAIAIRRTVSEDISDGLVEAGDENVIVNLLSNPGAEMSFATLEFLVEQSKRVDSFQEPILRRQDLDPELAKRMYMWVAAALRKFIFENFEFDQGELDDILENAALEVAGADKDDKHRTDETSERLITELDREGGVTPELLLDALRSGQVHLFVSLCRRLTGLRQTLITRFILEASGEGLAITFNPDFPDR